jgi:hypothetical protein
VVDFGAHNGFKMIFESDAGEEICGKGGSGDLKFDIFGSNHNGYS